MEKNKKEIPTTMRMRVLTHTSSGKLLKIADEVTKWIEADKPTDSIMPAYPCDGERLIIIVATAKATMPEDFFRFVRSLKKSVTANVAFLMDGTPENVAKIIEMAKTNDAHIIEDVHYFKAGLPFKFINKVTDEELENVRRWVEKIRTQMV